MLVEMAIADAYTIAWEFTDDQDGIPDFTQYYQHPTYSELKPGMFTDDTQRAIANSLVLLRNRDNSAYNPVSYLLSLHSTYYNDPRDGYSRNFQKLLIDNPNPADFIRNCHRTAISNGSVMGVAPLGYIQNLSDCKLAASLQAMSTHHPSTCVHAQLVALAANAFIHQNMKKSSLLEFLYDNVDWHPSGTDKAEWVHNIDWYRVSDLHRPTIKASRISSYVAYAIEKFDTMTQILSDVIRRGGDTDSAATTTIAIASVCSEIENDIPKALYDQLDNNTPYNIDELKWLDDELVKDSK